MTEDDYCRAFANALVNDSGFRQWVLEQTKFADRRNANLMLEEQSVRVAKAWWRHWWTQLPDGSQSETDIFAVFQDSSDGFRFALHIECKKGNGRFMPNQPSQYALRGEFMKANKWAPYSEFETVLLTPDAFKRQHPYEANAFGAFISFEGVAKWLSVFRE